MHYSIIYTYNPVHRFYVFRRYYIVILRRLKTKIYLKYISIKYVTVDIHVLWHLLIVTRFIVVYFKETLASAPWRWREILTPKYVGSMWKIMHVNYIIVHMFGFTWVFTELNVLFLDTECRPAANTVPFRGNSFSAFSASYLPVPATLTRTLYSTEL